MSDALALVRRAARKGADFAALAEDLGERLGEAERAVSAELRRTRRGAARLVDSFGRLAEALGTREARGRAARLRASYELHGGRAADAVGDYERAAALLTGRARDGARLGLAGALLRLGRTEDAARLCSRIGATARRRGDEVVAAAAALNGGVAWIEAGRPERALTPLGSAASTLAGQGNELLAASAEQSLANALVQLDRAADAVALLASAALRLDALGMRHESARCRLNQGALLRRLERLDDAEEALVAAEEAARKTADAALAAQCRLERAETLLTVGLAAEALDLVRSARAPLRRAPPVDRARAALVEARASLTVGDVDGAARRIARPLPAETPLLAGRRRLLRAHVALLRGRPRVARDEAVAAARQFARRHPVSRVTAWVLGADACRRAGDSRRARALLSRADAEPGTQENAFAAAVVRFLLEADAGRRRPADAALRSVLDRLGSLRAGRGTDRTRAALLIGREGWIASAVRHLLDGADGPARALTLLDEVRARALLDLRADVAAVDSDSADVARLRRQVESLERRLDGDPGDGLVRGDMDSAPVRRHLARAQRDLTRALAPRHGGADSAGAAAKPVPAGTVRVLYHTDDAGTLAFVEDEDGSRVHSLPVSSADLTALVRKLRFCLSQHAVGAEFRRRHAGRLDARVRDALGAVSGAVLGPVAHDLARAARIEIVPDGPLYLVPFPALPLSGRPLVARHEIGLLPARTLSRPGRAARGAPVVMAHADAQAAAIREEAAHVAALLPRARLLTGAGATRAALAKRVRPRVLHVAAHGRHRPESPAMSGVLLADGWLRAADLAHADLAGSLVVLSGCETGVATPTGGGEVLGLVRAAFLAGARSVVASLWPVDDPATARLMGLFHQRAVAGADTAAALAAAQRDMALDGTPAWFWAGFAAWTGAAKS